MGKPVADVFGIGQQQLLIGGNGLFFSLGGTHQAVLNGTFGILPDEAMGRVERSGGALGHVGDAGPADRAHLRCGCVEEFLAVKNNGPGGDAASLAGVAHGGQPQGGFAGPGFADQTENFTLVQRQVEALDDRFPGLAGQTVDHDIFHLKQWCHEFLFFPMG